MKALKVLLDCKECYWDLKDALEKNDQQQIRIKWITCLTFLRMVGHVLDKVDKVDYPSKKSIFLQLFNEKKDDDIFKNFIEKERNLAVKEYKLLILPDNNEVETEVGILFEDGSRMLTESGEYLVYEGTQKVNHFSTKDTTGEVKRLDNWIDDAIKWWENYMKDLVERLKD